MQVEYINPFITSLANTFDTMLSCSVHRENLKVKGPEEQLHEVSGIIGLSGRAVGTVVVSLSKEVAIKAASTMLMMELDEVNDDVLDAVGEITNMVAGGAKAQLEQYALSISLPNVVTGVGHNIRFPSEVHPLRVMFRCDWGPLSIDVGLEEVAVPAAI